MYLGRYILFGCLKHGLAIGYLSGSPVKKNGQITGYCELRQEGGKNIAWLVFKIEK